MQMLLVLVALATGLISHAFAQGTYPGQLPANSLYGNPTGSAAAGTAPAFNQLGITRTPQYYDALCGQAGHDCTTALNSMMSDISVNGMDGYIPCGTYTISGTVTIPGKTPPAYTSGHLYGAGPCSLIQMASGHATTNLLQVGSGVHNDTADFFIEKLAFGSAVQQTNGAGIEAKGTARVRFKDIYMEDTHMSNCIVLDGVDFHNITHLECYGPQFAGVVAFDGFDCGFTPQAVTTNGTTSTSSGVILTANTTGVSVGMNVYDLNWGPNFLTGITVQSIVTNTSITMNGNVPKAIGNGDSLVFGGDCTGTSLSIDGDTHIINAGVYGVALRGGVGGVTMKSMQIFSTAASAALEIDVNNSQGIYNREIFLNNFDAGVDSNTSYGLFAATNSFSYLLCTGCWINGSGNDDVFISAQHSQGNPPESGAVVQFSGCKLGQSNGNGINWEDTGTLTVTGCDISYSFGTNTSGIRLAAPSVGVATVVITGNKIKGNQQYGIISTANVATGIIANNILSGNGTSSTNGITNGSGGYVCVNNAGTPATNAGC